MRKLFLLLALCAAGITGIAGSAFAQTPAPQTRTLIIYYSKTGRTEAVAKEIQKQTGADILRIEPAVPYPSNYNKHTKLAQEELDARARPAVKTALPNLDSYDYIFIGYPIWWGTMPMPMFTLLESHDFSGKVIAPFCTSGSTGLGDSVRDITALCPNSTIREGLDIEGKNAKKSADSVSQWLAKVY